DDLPGGSGGTVHDPGRSRGLRTRVLGLVLVTLIPAASLIAYSSSEQRRQAQAIVERRALELAERAAQAERRVLDETGELLRLVWLAAADTFSRPLECQSFMRRVQAAYPRYLNVGVATVDGAYLCGALLAE